MPRAVLEYLLHLYATIILPTTLWIIATAHIFYMLRSFSGANYQEQVRESLCDTVIEQICKLHHDLFPQYGLTPYRLGPLV